MERDKKTVRSRGRKIKAEPKLEREPSESPSLAVDNAFKEDDKVREVLTKHLPTRARESSRIAARARAAFTKFNPSMFTAAQRESRNYLAPDQDLTKSMDAAVETGVASMRESAGGRRLKIHLDENLRRLVTDSPGEPGSARIQLEPVIKLLREKLAGAPTLRNNPAFAACVAKAKAAAVLDQIDGGKGQTPVKTDEPSGVPPTPVGDNESSATTDFVRKQVHGLMEKVTSPEEQLLFESDEKRADLDDTEKNVDSFQLRKGASDVISYHDFKVLQIAFEHVWTELFDDRLTSLGTELYHEAAQLETFLRPDGTTNLNATISSIPDLVNFLNRVSELSQTATNSIYVDFGVIGEGGKPVVEKQVALIAGAQRLSRLLSEIDRLLRQRYAFAVFAKDSVNFGILVTYRQTWKPENYQVGDLISTVPLAPRETRRYTVKHVVKKTRAAKSLEDSLRNTRSESSGTSRVEREIIDKAQAKTDFDLTSHGSFGGEGYKADVTAKAGGEQATQSEKAKKHFHEAVLKSAQEYRQQNKMEIDTTTSEETEETTFHEIQNPNDELTVTYMFYELQRTFRISEKIHQLTPVVLVANEMPAPNAIDDAWLIRHDWILRRVILDDSFTPALEYLTKSFVGAELNIRLLENNAQAQKQIVDKLNQQIETQNQRIERDERGLADTVKKHADAKEIQGAVNEVARIFDPLGITGKKGEGTISAGETMVDYLQETFDRVERERARLLDQLGVATTALQVAIDKLSEATKEHYDRIAEIDRVRIHVKENILYYMQAIWSHEPPDQRFFRIYNIEVPIAEPDTSGVPLTVNPVPLTSLMSFAAWLRTCRWSLGASGLSP